MKALTKWFLLFGLGTMVLLQSCGVNSNLMFKQAKGDVNFDSIPMFPKEAYRISPDDKLTFTLATNNGSRIIESMSGLTRNNVQGVQRTEYLVRGNGSVELPVVGIIHVEGLTIEECEDTLTYFFSKEYKEPFVQVNITNNRVIVFPGDGSDAQVIPIVNANTTLMEALALAGGITDRGKANTIKLIRKENGVRQVYGIDLSTIDGLMYVDMVVQANDYIYVEPTPEISKEIAEDIVPIVSLISSALFIYSAVTLFK